MATVATTLQALRALGVSVQMHASADAGVGSFKNQFKKADSSGARYALIFGADELAQGKVALKALRGSSGGSGAAGEGLAAQQLFDLSAPALLAQAVIS
jgi:histidyl-tRNA synthetase